MEAKNLRKENSFLDRTNPQSITVGGEVVKNSISLAGSGCCFFTPRRSVYQSFTDTLPHAANPYGATTIRTSPTRVTHSPLSSNPFSGLMLPELLALTGNFESSALHSEPSYSLYGASCVSRQHILSLKRRIFFL